MGRSLTAAKPQRRNADTKLARLRLSVLELVKELGNVGDACRQRGLDRTSLYEWPRRIQTQGFDGLKDLPPIHKSLPQTTPEPVVQRIKDLALSHPVAGCNHHEAMLALEGVRVSAITIQKFLNDNRLGSKVERWLAPEAQNAGKAIESPPCRPPFWKSSTPASRKGIWNQACRASYCRPTPSSSAA